jgi:hypothetical protein
MKGRFLKEADTFTDRHNFPAFFKKTKHRIINLVGLFSIFSLN